MVNPLQNLPLGGWGQDQQGLGWPYLLVTSTVFSTVPLYTVGKLCLFSSLSKQMDLVHVKGPGKEWLLPHVWTVTALAPGQQEMVRAKWKMVVSLILFIVSPGDGLFHAVYRSILVSQSFKGDAGQPLFLSPYIKNGKIKEGKCCTGNCCYLLKFVLFHFTALYSMVF